jgi:hypothetical protein
MRRFVPLFACLLGSAAACGSDPSAVLPPPVDHDAQGSWGQDTHGAITPGSSFVMALTESDGVIDGVGSFAGEAAPYGGLRVSGTVSQDSVHLRIIFIAEPTVFPSLKPDTAQFAGLLTSKNAVRGQLTRSSGISGPFDLIRLMIGDPP